MAMMSKTRRPCWDDWKTCAEPWKLALMVAGMCKSVWSFCTRSTAVPKETPGTRLKEMVTDGNWPTWECSLA